MIPVSKLKEKDLERERIANQIAEWRKKDKKNKIETIPFGVSGIVEVKRTSKLYAPDSI
jgi:hypothetical protein